MRAKETEKKGHGMEEKVEEEEDGDVEREKEKAAEKLDQETVMKKPQRGTTYDNGPCRAYAYEMCLLMPLFEQAATYKKLPADKYPPPKWLETLRRKHRDRGHSELNPPLSSPTSLGALQCRPQDLDLGFLRSTPAPPSNSAKKPMSAGGCESAPDGIPYQESTNGARVFHDTISQQVNTLGFSDGHLAGSVHRTELEQGTDPLINQIDNVAGEWPADSNYLDPAYHATQHDIESKQAAATIRGFSYSGKFGRSTAAAKRDLDKSSTIQGLKFEQTFSEVVMDIYQLENPDGVILCMGGQLAWSIAMESARQNAKSFGVLLPSTDNAQSWYSRSETVERIELKPERPFPARCIVTGGMAEREEVFVVKTAQGEAVRTFVKDDSLNMHALLRATLAYLTHLGTVDAERIMTGKLALQVNGTEWSWKNLSTLCWATRSASEAMRGEDGMRLLATAIKAS